MVAPTNERTTDVLPAARGSRWSHSLWFALVEPIRPSRAEPMQPQLLSLLLLLIIPALLTAALWSANWFEAPGFQGFLLVSSALLFIAYLINRLGRYAISASIVVFLLSALPYAALATDQAFQALKVVVVMVCIVPGIIAAYLLFSLRGTAFAVLFSLIAMILLPITVPQIKVDLLIFPLYFGTIVAGLMLIAAVMRMRYAQMYAEGQRALGESEQRYRDLFEATFEPIAVHDKGIIIDANPALATMLHVPLDHIIGRHVTQFIHPEDHITVTRNARESVIEPYQARVLRGDGHVLPVEIRGKSHVYRGKLQRVVGVRDISLSKRAESHRIELAVEREKVNVLQRFIGNMSHDLRTPLTVIKTSVYLFKRLKDDPEKQEQQIETLAAQVDHLNRLFDDLLSMARLDKADTSDYRFKWTNINTPTLSAIHDHTAIALRRHQQIVFDAGQNLPDVFVDYDEFKRMINHLILNALGYTPENGIVTVQTSHTDQNVLIAVRDNGIGISPLELPFIFERFYRKDSLQSSDDGGTGLGLNIARKIAEAHGGYITVQSEVGIGSVFTVHLPHLPDGRPDSAPTTSVQGK
jgi:PAS domain S-box-containing protein